MRRKDREMGREFALSLIDNAEYGVLSTFDTEGIPYGIPLSIVRNDQYLYFHSAKEGRKVNIFKTNQRICVTFVGEINIPELYDDEELDEFLTDKQKGNTVISKVFTTEFESAMVFGKLSLVEQPDEVIEAMRLICQKYTPVKMKLFELAIETSIKQTNVYKISIDGISAKRKKFGSNGEELKWQRE